MPVDKFMLDAMLNTFRNMMQECRDKNMTGDDINQMESTLQRMEHLGQEMNDVGAFSGQMVQEGLFMKFSDHYGKALAAAAQASSPSANGYDDATDKNLLQQTVQAYKDAVQKLKNNKQQVKAMLGDHAADADVLLKDKAAISAIEKVIQLGESGVSYPFFLAEMIKQGMDKAMEGAAISREAQVYQLDAAKATAANPYYIQKEEEKLLLYDDMSNASPIRVPASLVFTLGCEKIEWRLAPIIQKWNKQKEGWERAVFMLDEWITAYCSFAPHIEPWAQAKDPAAAVVESQECVPGKLRAWETIYQRYFDTTLVDLFRHASVGWDVQHHWMYWSQEYLTFLLKEVAPVCIPAATPLAALVETAAAFHTEKKKINPAVGEPSRRYSRYFDNYFGEGEFVKRYGAPAAVATNALPWQWDSFFMAGT